jgi:uncharacterized membrane protein YdjX (TVP38/TMEM64 family)
MTGWRADRGPGRAARTVLAVALLALALVAVVPVALLAAVVMMMLGHVTGGLALAGGSVLAAAAAVTAAGMSGRRQLRKLLSGHGPRIVRLDGSWHGDAPGPGDGDGGYRDAVRLDRADYTEVR